MPQDHQRGLATPPAPLLGDMLRKTTAPSSIAFGRPEVFRSDRGELRIVVQSPRLVLTQVRGRFCDALTASFVSTFDRWLAFGGERLLAFHDWEGMTDYDLGGRVALTAWSTKHRRRFDEIHFFLSEPLVRVGVEIANFALGRFMTTHASRASFDAAYQAAEG